MGSFFEFFAGGGMARAGLGPAWTCTFANDFDPRKGASYRDNWGDAELLISDVGKLKTTDLPGAVDLAWASFPCQDLSLAGAGAGLKGQRSGTFKPFWRLMKALAKENRAPRLIVLENVCGTLTSHNGKDFATIGAALVGANYRFGALIIDAVHFVPQSRPRLFIVAVRADQEIPADLLLETSNTLWHPAKLTSAYEHLSKRSKSSWVWWRLPPPARRNTVFADLLEDNPTGVSWHTPVETQRILDLMSSLNAQKIENAKKSKKRVIGTVYKRTRPDGNGGRIQRAEIRFDDIAGCLRTPVGGSSRQTIMEVNGNRVHSRLLSPREAVRLMGLSDEYKIPIKYNEAYHLAGDGVVVPVVRYLAEHILEPLIAICERHAKAAA